MISRKKTKHITLNKNTGFTLVEQVISLGISSIILAIIIMAYNISMEMFDDQLSGAQLRVDLRDAAETLKRDLRNANAVTYPAAAGLLTTFVLDDDGLTYSYYVNANNHLVRQLGTSGVGGRALAKNLEAGSSSITKVGDLYVIELQASVEHHVTKITSSIKPRNI